MNRPDSRCFGCHSARFAWTGLGALTVLSCATGGTVQAYSGPARESTHVATITVGAFAGVALLRVDDTNGTLQPGMCFRFGDVLGAAVQVLPGRHRLEVAGRTGVIETFVNAEAGAEYRIRLTSGQDCVLVQRSDMAGAGPSPTACITPNPLLAAVAGRPAEETSGLSHTVPILLPARSLVVLYTIDGKWGPNSWRDGCYTYNNNWDSGFDIRVPPGRHVLEVHLPHVWTHPRLLTQDFQPGRKYKLARTKDAAGYWREVTILEDAEGDKR
jgi:outer membrane lipoprotein SlyB